MAGVKGQKKRFQSDGEKRLICRRARAPGVSVAQGARRTDTVMVRNCVKRFCDPRRRLRPIALVCGNSASAFKGVLSRAGAEAWPPNADAD